MKRIESVLDVDLKAKLVLVRVDHNVVKKGKIKDPMRIDASIPTFLQIIKSGGLPVLMSHVGRPYDKATKTINISEAESVQPIVNYLNEKLGLNGLVCDLPATDEYGISDLNPLAACIEKLKNKEVDYLYLPNTRWFKGEEAKDEGADTFAKKLASYFDLYVNDAFGSWQPHASTYHITGYLPSYAGLLMLKEIESLDKIFIPKKPLVAVVAGSKFDTKIGPLSALIEIADRLVLGGVIYNAYLAAKYGIKVSGLTAEDIEAAQKFIDDCGENVNKIVELPYVVVNDNLEERREDSFKVCSIQELASSEKEVGYILDAAQQSFDDEAVKEVFASAGTVFINAVMGYTALFAEGSMAMYSLIDDNKKAVKLYGGGDTIQDFKTYLPELFEKAKEDDSYYFFTGGGAILSAIENRSAYGMKPVQALIKE